MSGCVFCSYGCDFCLPKQRVPVWAETASPAGQRRVLKGIHPTNYGKLHTQPNLTCGQCKHLKRSRCTLKNSIGCRKTYRACELFELNTGVKLPTVKAN